MHQSVRLAPFSIPENLWMVPCICSQTSNEFVPLCAPRSESIDWKKLQSRQPWLTAEDQALEEIVSVKGTKAWAAVARELNRTIHSSLPLRQSKQCRERYFNHVDANLSRTKWSNAEDSLIFHKQRELGNKWREIARYLDGRTENQVKNRFKSLARKAGKSELDAEGEGLEGFIQELNEKKGEERLLMQHLSGLLFTDKSAEYVQSYFDSCFEDSEVSNWTSIDVQLIDDEDNADCIRLSNSR